MMGDLDALLDTIDQLDAEDDEVDPFPWTDAARWCPAAITWAAPYDDGLPEFTDDGAVVICDPLRPWVVTAYTPPWRAE